MSKKKVLIEEGAVRQFMKLANLAPLSEEFVSDLYEGEEEVNEEDEVVEEGEDEVVEVNLGEGALGTALGGAAKLGASALGAGDTDAEGAGDVVSGVTDMVTEEEPLEDEDLGLEEPAPEEGGEDKSAAVADALQVIADALSDAGVDVSVEAGGGEEEAPLEEPGLDAAPEEEMPLPDEEAPANMGTYEENMESAVSAIAERVMNRITKEKKKKDAASLVAERVLKRIEKLSKK